MFTKEEIKENLVGCFEVLLFMKSGIDRFKNIARKDAIKSFAVPVVMLPIVMAVQVMTSKEGYTIPYIITVHFIRMFASFGLYLGLVYYISKLLEKQQYFSNFVVVANWWNIIGLIMVLPIVFYVFQGFDVTGIENYAIFISVMGYVYMGFILTHTLRIPWEMGGFIAISGLAVDETIWDIIIYFFGDITLIDGT